MEQPLYFGVFDGPIEFFVALGGGLAVGDGLAVWGGPVVFDGPAMGRGTTESPTACCVVVGGVLAEGPTDQQQHINSDHKTIQNMQNCPKHINSTRPTTTCKIVQNIPYKTRHHITLTPRP